MSFGDGSPGRGKVSLMNDVPVNDNNVDVVVPLVARYASTLRTMSASFGADTGFSIDEIDDIKLAISEAFSMLVNRHAGKRARISFTVASSALDVRLSLESGADIAVEPDELALAILKAVVDSYTVESDAISLRKVAIETLLLDK
jgi:serine/threonine-protein kinase RsbW